MSLIGILACVCGRVYSEAPAERGAIVNTEADRKDPAEPETGPGIAPEDQPRIRTVLVLHTLKVRRPWNVLFNRYLKEALQQGSLPPHELEIENLDLLQFNNADYQAIVKRQLAHKYGGSTPDVIVITFASTISFVVENDLFSGRTHRGGCAGHGKGVTSARGEL